MAMLVAAVPERAVAPPGGDLQFARVEQPSEIRKVENEDIAHCLFRFESGVLGSMVTSRTAWGRKNGPDVELFGTLAGVRYRQERFNEFELFRADAHKDGYRKVHCGPYITATTAASRRHPATASASTTSR